MQLKDKLKVYLYKILVTTCDIYIYSFITTFFFNAFLNSLFKDANKLELASKRMELIIFTLVFHLLMMIIYFIILPLFFKAKSIGMLIFRINISKNNKAVLKKDSIIYHSSRIIFNAVFIIGMHSIIAAISLLINLNFPNISTETSLNIAYLILLSIYIANIIHAILDPNAYTLVEKLNRIEIRVQGKNGASDTTL